MAKSTKQIVDDAAEGKDKSGASKVIAHLESLDIIFWHDPDGGSYASIPRNGHIERYRTNSRGFINIVRASYGKMISKKTMDEVLATIDSLAIQGQERKPAVRLMEHKGAIYIDLGTDDWSMVKVTMDGWSVVPSVDLPLIRPQGLRPMMVPRRTRFIIALYDLGELLNIQSENDYMMYVAWLVMALYPHGPYPVLSIDGEAGTAKTTACTTLRNLIDPNLAPLRGTPKSEEDLMLAATNSRVVGFDNMSSMSPDLADGLCKIATGAGFGTRLLYANGEEYLIAVCRPVLLNGINSIIARGDLADRSISLTLAPIAEGSRRTEKDMVALFEEKAPGILGALLDGLVMVLRDRPTLTLAKLPRMADFALVACAAAPAFGWKAERMLAAIFENRKAVAVAVADSDPVAVALRDVVATQGGEWTGTAAALMALLNSRTDLDIRRSRAWPKDVPRLGAKLRRIVTPLRAIGMTIELPTSGNGKKGRQITIKIIDPDIEQAFTYQDRPRETKQDGAAGVTVN
jgi:putative DNA primase/helicase